MAGHDIGGLQRGLAVGSDQPTAPGLGGGIGAIGVASSDIGAFQTVDASVDVSGYASLEIQAYNAVGVGDDDGIDIGVSSYSVSHYQGLLVEGSESPSTPASVTTDFATLELQSYNTTAAAVSNVSASTDFVNLELQSYNASGSAVGVGADGIDIGRSNYNIGQYQEALGAISAVDVSASADSATLELQSYNVTANAEVSAAVSTDFIVLELQSYNVIGSAAGNVVASCDFTVLQLEGYDVTASAEITATALADFATVDLVSFNVTSTTEAALQLSDFGIIELTVTDVTAVTGGNALAQVSDFALLDINSEDPSISTDISIQVTEQNNLEISAYDATFEILSAGEVVLSDFANVDLSAADPSSSAVSVIEAVITESNTLEIVCYNVTSEGLSSGDVQLFDFATVDLNPVDPSVDAVSNIQVDVTEDNTLEVLPFDAVADTLLPGQVELLDFATVNLRSFDVAASAVVTPPAVDIDDIVEQVLSEVRPDINLLQDQVSIILQDLLRKVSIDQLSKITNNWNQQFDKAEDKVCDNTSSLNDLQILYSNLQLEIDESISGAVSGILSGDYVTTDQLSGHTGETGIHYEQSEISISTGQIYDFASYAESVQSSADQRSEDSNTAISGVSTTLTSHISDFNNPHQVTPAQIGAATTGDLDTFSLAFNSHTANSGIHYTQSEISIDTSQLTDFDASDFTGHTGETGVHFTVDQISLPVSQLQAAATSGYILTTDGTTASWQTGASEGYRNRYIDNAQTRLDSDSTVEVYYTARPDGDGYVESEITTSTPAGFIVERKLYFSDKFDADPNTASDWTLYTTQPVDNTVFATAKASLLAGLNNTDGTANTRGTLPVSLKMTHRFSQDQLLEDFPGAAAAYSLRKISSDYLGNAIRIREDGGNTETDIGFDSNGDLDTDAIAAFCGLNNGFVVIWYDQSGNNRNATAAADTNEPKIYDGTTGVHTTNGKPAIQFDGTDDSLDLPNAVQPANINNCSAFTVQANTTGFGLELGDSSNNVRWYQTYVTSGTEYFGYGPAATAVNLGTASLTQKLITAIAGSTQGNAQAFVDGVSKGTYTLTSGVPAAGVGHIGGPSPQFATGDFQEVIIYHSDQSTNRTGIESDISAYWTANKLLLDSYPGADAVYSLRKLDNDYNGNCIRIRRSSDNTEQDIGFNSNGELDTDAIETFCTTSNGYVVTWYDQSGNGQNVTQAAASSQPQIYDGTAVLTDNGKPYVDFDGSDDLLTATNTAFDGTNQSMFIINNSDTTAGNRAIVALGPLAGHSMRNLTSSHQLETINNNKNWTGVSGSQQLIALMPTGGVTVVDDFDLYRNGSLLTPTSVNGTTNLVSCAGGLIKLGYNFPSTPGNASYHYDGKLQEVVMFNNDQSSNRTGIESIIDTYYKPTTALLLDIYSGAAAAYSVRKLSQWYTGPCMRIRRDSDDAETDIGFDSNGDLDTAAIASHCGSANGYVVTWYDQSGNGKDATQSTTSAQPQIYNGSATILDNGKPAIQWTTANTLQTASTLPAADLNAYSTALVFSGGSGFQVPVKVIQGAAYVYPLEINSGNYWVRWGGAAARTSLGSTSGSQHLEEVYGRDSATTSYAYLDGTSTSILNGGTAVAANHSIIFGIGGGSAFSGKMQEHIIWHADMYANQSGINSNINAYFSIYP